MICYTNVHTSHEIRCELLSYVVLDLLFEGCVNVNCQEKRMHLFHLRSIMAYIMYAAIDYMKLMKVSRYILIN